MTYETECTQFDMAMELLINNGFNGMAVTMKILMDSAMKSERGRYHLHADPYEQTVQRHSNANGFNPKTIKTRVGEIQLAVPQARDSKFYPSSLERGPSFSAGIKYCSCRNVYPRCFNP